MQRKKILRLLMIASTISGITFMQNLEVKATENQLKGNVVNVNSNLRVRKSPSLNSEVMGALLNGEEISITGENGSWYEINYKGKKGYVSKSYVKIAEKNIKINNVSNNENSSIQKGVVVNVHSVLRVRSEADINSQILGFLTNGCNVNILGEKGNWYNISYNGKNAYISKDYVKVSGESSNSSSSNNSNTGSNVSNSNAKNNDASNSNVGSNSSEETSINKSGKVVVNSSLNIRNGASLNSKIIGLLYNGSNVMIVGESGNWYKIKHGSSTAYVSKDYVKITGESNNSSSESNSNTGNNASNSNAGSNSSEETSINKSGKVVVNSSLNIRNGASLNSKIIGLLYNGSNVTIVGESGNWYKIKHGSSTAYVSKDYVKVTGESSNSSSGNNSSSGSNSNAGNNASNSNAGNNTNNSNVENGSNTPSVPNNNGSSENSNVTSSTYDVVYNAMKQYVGSPYVWGGSGELLTTSFIKKMMSVYPSQAAAGRYNRALQYADQGYRAFDCSGLMQWGYRQAGIYIGRSTYDQIFNGVEVSIYNVKPGDLLFYSDLGHVGMYVGNDMWIEAPNSNANVRIVSVPWSKIGRARRIIN